MSVYRDKIAQAKATRKYRLTKTKQITPYIRKHLNSIRKECAKVPEDKWCAVAAWTILQRDKVDIFRDDKIWDIPQNVRKYIKQTIVSDFNEDPGPLFSFEKTQNFDNITSVLEKQVEMIDGQINELMRSKQQVQNAIKAVNDIVK
jgi:hypothetical protein|tara:strand:+ start:134 stop:571 length:438 start_codon:yes stop_codon:yes gene_type:complete